MLSLVSAEIQRGSPGARPPRPASPRATPGQPPGHRSFRGSKSTTDRGKTAHCLQAATKRKTLAQDQGHHSQDRATRAVVAQSTTAKRLGRKAEAPGTRRQKNRVERHTGSDTTAPGPNVTPQRRQQTKDRPATSRPPAGHSRHGATSETQQTGTGWALRRTGDGHQTRARQQEEDRLAAGSPFPWADATALRGGLVRLPGSQNEL